MRLTPTLAAVCLVALTAMPGLAQGSVYYSVPAPVLPSPLHPLTLREFAQALSTGTPKRALSAPFRAPASESLIIVQRTCPMPVLHPDSARLEPMPVTVVDTNRVQSMPVARSSCQNTLRR
jgi:hypothetical protein